MFRAATASTASANWKTLKQSLSVREAWTVTSSVLGERKDRQVDRHLARYRLVIGALIDFMDPQEEVCLNGEVDGRLNENSKQVEAASNGVRYYLRRERQLNFSISISRLRCDEQTYCRYPCSFRTCTLLLRSSGRICPVMIRRTGSLKILSMGIDGVCSLLR